jgi:Ca2+-binding EF-hand superfamily protein
VAFHRLQQTPEERQAHQQPLLSKAEAELAEYCSALPGEGEESEKCWAAYDYFEQRKDEAESGCEVDWTSGKRDGPDCGKLDSFESLVRQLLGQAPMKSFAHMLYTLRKADQHAQQPSGKLAGQSAAEQGNASDNGRRRLVALFHAMDKDGNGKLDVAEFRDALAKLGMQHLTGSTVSTIFSAMDIHGPITLEDFLHIVEAEEINSDTPVSRWLRAHRVPSKFWGEPLNAA